MTPITFLPISTWPAGDYTAAGARKASPFGASYPNTLEVLDRELRMLDVREVVIELALRETHIRADGLPRANAPRPEHPGVVLSFDSRHGPLRYATDRFTTWQANVRAIALGLESLRRVDRYGITKRGEQYAGWRQLPAAGESGTPSGDEARAFLRELTGLESPDHADAVLVRAAQKVAHPDRGGKHETWLRVQAAAETLEVAG